MTNSLHWTDNGTWSIYKYGDMYRGLHKKDTGEVSYFEFFPTGFGYTLEQQAVACHKTYAKPREWVSCIRCSTHRNVESREDYNNAMLCNRCYEVICKGPSDYGVVYEILPSGLKGKVIKDE